MAVFQTLLVLLTCCVALAVLAQRLRVPVAVPLILGGMTLALLPGLPAVTLDPALALALFLPPLLQLSAYRTDWTAFRSSLGPILLLAVGAVAFSATAVAFVARLLVPGLPWWAAFALGAIVAPPDAVAATSVLKRFRLPRRLVVVLEGESLVNDASSLVLYRFAVAAVAAGGADYGLGLLQFVGTAAGGAAVGWLVGRATMKIFERIDDTLLDIMVSLLAGFAAYLAAEALHASGVLAAVACGFVLGRHQHAEFSARTRLELDAVGHFVEFVLASLVFILIGLQLRGIVERLVDYDLWHLMQLGAAVSATLIASRFVWVFPMTWLSWLLSRRRGRAAAGAPRWDEATALSWAGMRGVVSLAAALALPERFPGRDLIVFLAFCSILATLVLQGTTLGWLVRRLNVEEPGPAAKPEKAQLRAEIAEAELAVVKAQLEGEATDEAGAAAKLVEEYELRVRLASGQGGDGAREHDDRLEAQLRLRLLAIDAARSRLAHQAGPIDADSHRTLAEELDLEEQRIRRALGEK